MKRLIFSLAVTLGLFLIAACSGGSDAVDDASDTTDNGSNSSSSSTTTSTGVYTQTSGTKTLTSATYSSTKSDENVIKVTGGTLNLNNCTITKSGDTGDTDNSSFLGTNSAVYVGGSGAVINMTGGTITTNAQGANGGFAYNGGTLNISNVTINNSKTVSRGIHATGGGIINAYNLTVTTQAATSSTIATDRGGGTVTVWGGSFTAKGDHSAVLYSTGKITAHEITGTSANGEIGIIEGDNTIDIDSCNITAGSAKRGLMILQSGSGDANGYHGIITVNSGTLTLTDTSAPLCEVPTNITGTLTLTDVTLTVPSKILMYVDYNTQWKTYGGTGNLVLNTNSSWTYSGTVAQDSYGKVNVTVKSGVTWNVTGNVTLNSLTVEKGGVVNLNGHTLTASSKTNNGTINS
ncbi:MAG: hypothetical protein LKF33_06415 [Prevotella sp.]|jgi:hypothetical protein|nr:hypothetical protein [Prevotella sp.]